MRVSGYRSSNVWLRRQLDTSWRGWALRLTAAAALLSVALAALVGPRQTAVRLRYQIAQVNSEVERLAQANRRLALERETLTSPRALAAELEPLGLAPLVSEQIVFLTADGRLVAAAREQTPRRGGT